MRRDSPTAASIRSLPTPRISRIPTSTHRISRKATRSSARYDDLVNGKEEKIDVSKVDVSMNGIELQDREFFAAIKEGREPNSSVAQVLPCYQVLHQLDQQLAAG